MKEVLISLLIVGSIAAPHYSNRDEDTSSREPYEYKYEVKDESTQLFFDKSEQGDEAGMV